MGRNCLLWHFVVDETTLVDTIGSWNNNQSYVDSPPYHSRLLPNWNVCVGNYVYALPSRDRVFKLFYWFWHQNTAHARVAVRVLVAVVGLSGWLRRSPKGVGTPPLTTAILPRRSPKILAELLPGGLDFGGLVTWAFSAPEIVRRLPHWQPACQRSGVEHHETPEQYQALAAPHSRRRARPRPTKPSYQSP